MATYINPNTDGELEVLITDSAGNAVTNATAEADVYNPLGALVGDGISLTNEGAGYYRLPIAAAWSVDDAEFVEGEYVAHVVAVSGGITSTKRCRYVVRFDDDD